MTETEPVLTAREILDSTEGKTLKGGDSWSCAGISTDTRTLAAGNLFIALAGENFDGHDHLAGAAEKGAAGLVISIEAAAKISSAATRSVPVIGVPDTLDALGRLARHWRLRFPIPVVAITGSSGKTTTKEMVATIASRSINILKTEGNLNNRIGLPLTMFRLRRDHEMAVVEMGTNCPGEIAALTSIAVPDIGLITNIGPAHIEGLGSLEAIRDEKGSLFEVMSGKGTALVNRDDQAIRLLAKRLRGKVVTFGLQEGADITADNMETADPGGARFDLVIGSNKVPVSLAAVGEHNIRNAVAAAAASWVLGFTLEEIAAGLASFRPVPGRTEIRRLGNGAHLVIDTYNANPASMLEALKTVRGLHGNGKIVAILGDMLELGERSEELHREVGSRLAEMGIGELFLKGDLTKEIAAGAVRAGLPEERVAFFDDPRQVVQSLRSSLKSGDWVLVKGSRKMKMEAVAESMIAAFERKPQKERSAPGGDGK